MAEAPQPRTSALIKTRRDGDEEVLVLEMSLRRSLVHVRVVHTKEKTEVLFLNPANLDQELLPPVYLDESVCQLNMLLAKPAALPEEKKPTDLGPTLPFPSESEASSNVQARG